jgi:hypothetical protein
MINTTDSKACGRCFQLQTLRPAKHGCGRALMLIAALLTSPLTDQVDAISPS